MAAPSDWSYYWLAGVKRIFAWNLVPTVPKSEIEAPSQETDHDIGSYRIRGHGPDKEFTITIAPTFLVKKIVGQLGWES